MTPSHRSRSTTLAMNSVCVTAIFASIALLLLSQIYSSHALEFAGWSKPCKTGNDGSLVRPHEECEQSKGMVCQRYEQGEYCGCLVGSALTYDKAAKECRRKVGALCQKVATPEEEAKLGFNHRCHERAECVPLNGTSATSSPQHICLCKEGYYATSNLEECVSKSVATTMSSVSVASVMSAVSVSLLLVLAHIVR